jgi:hypothetical protein
MAQDFGLWLNPPEIPSRGKECAMRFAHLMFGGVVLAAAIAAPVSSASAHCYYRHCHYYGGPIGAVFGLAGAVIVGAATIATAPLVVAGDILAGPSYSSAYDDGAYRYSYRDDTFYRVRYHGPVYYRRYDRPYRYAYED